MRVFRLLGPVVITIILGTASCTYEVIAPEAPPPPPDTISFNDDIQPIFDASCAVSGCHDAGGWSPDLSAGNAYSSLTGGSTQYVDTDNPENSLLYQKINTGGSMEEYATAADRVNILTWIEKGAQNN